MSLLHSAFPAGFRVNCFYIDKLQAKSGQHFSSGYLRTAVAAKSSIKTRPPENVFQLQAQQIRQALLDSATFNRGAASGQVRIHCESTGYGNAIRSKGEHLAQSAIKNGTRFHRLCAVVLYVLVLSTFPLVGKTKKGDEYLKEGARAELREDYAVALELYDYALEEDSREPAYALADQRARRLASQQLVAEGRELAQAQKQKKAVLQFQMALRIDPHSRSAQEEIRKIEKQLESLPVPIVLDPPNDPLGYVGAFRSPRAAYENIGKLAGIKVTFDSAGIDSPKAEGQEDQDLYFWDMSGVTVEDALNNVARNTHTSWKAISSNTIYVTRESERKQPADEPVPMTRTSAREGYEQVSQPPMLSTLAPEDALRATSRAGKLPDVVHLVLEGTDVNARDSRGMTPLLFAVTGEHPEIVRFLLEHGADVNARFLLPGGEQTAIPGGGQTVLHAAVSHGNLQIAQFLLSAHADLEAVDAKHNTPLDRAVMDGQIEMVRLLLVHGADVKRTHLPDGRGLLHTVCAKGSANLIPLLVEFGADPTQRDRFGEAPLDLALAYSNENAVAVLLKVGGQRKQLQAAAEEAMENAIAHGYTETARILLENGLDGNKSTTQGSTYLGDAALKGQKGMVSVLLDHGANVKVRNRFGGTALHDAALGGSAAVIDLLLDHGAEIDARNLETGATPLIVATSLVQPSAVAELLKRGANTQLRDSSGRAALDRARESENAEIIRLLEGR